MASREEFYTALRNADAAGDVEGAKKLASYIQSMPADASVESKTQKAPSGILQDVGNLVAGAVHEAGSIGATILSPIDALARKMGVENSVIGRTDRRQAIGAGLQSMGEKVGLTVDPDSLAYGAGKLGAGIAGTLGVGGVLGAGAKAIGASGPIVNALATSGMQAGAPSVVGNALTRIAGAATTGGATAGLLNPNDAGIGATIGAALPIAGKAVNALAGTLRPFYAKGQDKIVKAALQEFSQNPNAVSNVASAQEIIPGSLPTSVMASGDVGLSGLNRTMQSSNPKYAADLYSRQTAQNSARTEAMEGMAGNNGKISLAEQARDEATGAMREDVLNRAGNVPSNGVLKSIDRLINNPENAGKISQQALNEVRNRISQFTQEGGINARALYAIRKDINDTLSGKLQGEAGNLKYASGQLMGVKDIIDEAIDKASRAVRSSPQKFGNGTDMVVSGRALAPVENRVGAFSGMADEGPLPTWKGYLQTYSEQSKPIEQMKIFDDILKRVQNGTVDSQGNAILSSAKLNNILKNETPELSKKLSQEQLGLLRNLAGDLNASQLSMTAGKSVGSNTVQNLGSNNVLANALGSRLGGSSPVANVLGRAMQIPYGMANKQIMEKMGNALLDPKEFTRIMQSKEGGQLLNALSKLTPATYKGAPVLPASR